MYMITGLSVSSFAVPPPLSAPIGVQALCPWPVVVWYSPEVYMFCEDTISGYEVRFYDPNFSQSNVTRYVGANRTFYGVTEEDRLAGENTHVQVIKIIMPHLMHNDITLGYFF